MARALILLIALIALPGAPVAAQMACGLYANQVMRLQMNYGESLRIRGASGQKIMELWVNDEKGTWSILVRYPNGMSCLRAAGDNFKAFEPELPGDDT